MKYCQECGAQAEDNDLFCKVCGSRLVFQHSDETKDETKSENKSIFEQGAEYINEVFDGQNFQDKIFDNVVNTPNESSDYDPQDINKNRILCMLSYISFLFLVPLVAAPDSKYARFHANQGLLLFLLGIATDWLFAIPVIGWILGLIAVVLRLICFISGILNSYKGLAKELPIIGKYRIIK